MQIIGMLAGAAQPTTERDLRNGDHAGASTRISGTAFQERLDFWARWGNVLSQTDYFYSPNLSRRLESIDLSVPSWR